MGSKVNAQTRVLAAAIQANVPAILWGEPGIAKSAVVETAFERNGYHVEPVIASHRDQSDFNGLPIVVEGNVVLSAPRWATTVNNADKAVVFLDEFTVAPASVQGAALRLLQERWCGETKIGDHVRFILAANPAECSAGGFDLSAPTANRMIHIDWVGPDAENWAQGLVGGWDSITPDFDDLMIEADENRIAGRKSLVAGYIMANPSALHTMPESDAEMGRAWASRRSWDNLAKMLPYIADDDNEALLLAAQGCVGEGAGTTFAVWMQNADLPDARSIMEKPESYDWTDTRMDRTFVLLANVVTLAVADETKESWTKAWKVLAACAKAGRADVATAAALRLMRATKAGWVPPKEIQAFGDILKRSGLLSDAKPKAA